MPTSHLRLGILTFACATSAVAQEVPTSDPASAAQTPTSTPNAPSAAPTAPTTPAPTEPASMGEEPAVGVDEVDYFMSVDEQLLKDVLVSTATKAERTLEQSPSIMTVFRREDLDRLNVRQLPDLLRYVPGFYEVSGQLERNFAIRGIHAASPQHFVVLIDGVRMNDFLFSTASLESFSLEYAERVEIIRGPGSAVYGANALMGVINIITPNSKTEWVREEATIGTRGLLRNDAAFSVPVGEGGSVFGAATFWEQQGDRRRLDPTEDILIPAAGQNISDGIQPGENLTQPLVGNQVDVGRQGPTFDLFLKYQHKDRSAVRLSIARQETYLQRNYRQALFHGGPASQTPKYATERVLLDVEKHWGTMDGKLGELTFRPTFQLFRHDMRSQRVGPEFYPQAAAEDASVIFKWSGTDVRVSPTLEYALNLPDAGPFKDNQVIVGFQPEYNVVTGYSMTRCYPDTAGTEIASVYTSGSAADLYCVEGLMLREGLEIDLFGNITEQPEERRFGDGDEWRVGGFLQLSTFLPGELGVVAGARVDTNEFYSAQLSPRIALVKPLGESFYTKAQYSSAFVYPAFLYRTGNSLSDYIGNPDIETQSVDTVEAQLGFKSSFMRAELSGYYNKVNRFITFDLSRNAQTGNYRFSNQGDLKLLGADLTTLLLFGGGRVTLNNWVTVVKPLSGTSSEFLVDDKLAGPSKFPQLVGMLMANVVPLERLNVMASMNYASPIHTELAREIQFSDIAGTDGQLYSSKPGTAYRTRLTTFNLAVSYSYELLKATVSVNNVFDRRSYRPGSVLVPYLTEGRQVTASLEANF